MGGFQVYDGVLAPPYEEVPPPPPGEPIPPPPPEAAPSEGVLTHAPPEEPAPEAAPQTAGGFQTWDGDLTQAAPAPSPENPVRAEEGVGSLGGQAPLTDKLLQAVEEHTPLDQADVDAVSGWVPPVAEAVEQLKQGRPLDALGTVGSVVQRPAEWAQAKMSERAAERAAGTGDATLAEDVVMAAPEALTDVLATGTQGTPLEGAAEAVGLGEVAHGTGYTQEQWIRDNPEEVERLKQTYPDDWELAAYDAYLQSMGLPGQTSQPYDSPFDQTKLDPGRYQAGIDEAATATNPEGARVAGDPTNLPDFALGAAFGAASDPTLVPSLAGPGVGRALGSLGAKAAATGVPVVQQAGEALSVLGGVARQVGRAADIASGDPTALAAATKGVFGLTKESARQVAEREVASSIGELAPARRDPATGALLPARPTAAAPPVIGQAPTRDPAAGDWVLPGGTPARAPEAKPVLDAALRDLAAVAPAEMWTRYDPALTDDALPARWRSALIGAVHAVDDHGPTRIIEDRANAGLREVLSPSGQVDPALVAAKLAARSVNPGFARAARQAEAGQRYVDLLAERVARFGDEEVASFKAAFDTAAAQRAAEALRYDPATPAGKAAILNTKQGLEQRAQALIDALRQADYPSRVVFDVDRGLIRAPITTTGPYIPTMVYEPRLPDYAADGSFFLNNHALRPDEKLATAPLSARNPVFAPTAAEAANPAGIWGGARGTQLARQMVLDPLGMASRAEIRDLRARILAGEAVAVEGQLVTPARLAQLDDYARQRSIWRAAWNRDGADASGRLAALKDAHDAYLSDVRAGRTRWQPGASAVPHTPKVGQTPNAPTAGLDGRGRLKVALATSPAAVQRTVEGIAPDSIISQWGVPISSRADQVLRGIKDDGTPGKLLTYDAGAGRKSATTGELFIDLQIAADQLAELSRKAVKSAADERAIGRLAKALGVDEAGGYGALTPQQLDDLAAGRTLEIWSEQVFGPNPKKRVPGLVNGVGAAIKEHQRAAGRMTLYNHANLPRFVLQNAAGNVFSTALTRPRALPDLLFGPFTFRRAVEIGTGKKRHSPLSSQLQQAGLGVDPWLRSIDKTGARGAAKGGPYGPAMKLLAPDINVARGDAWDLLHREAHYNRAFQQTQRQVVKSLPKRTEEWAGIYAKDHRLPVDGRALAKSLDAFFESKRVLYDADTGLPRTNLFGKTAKGNPTFTSTELRDFLEKSMTDMGVPAGAGTARFKLADRIARDYQEGMKAAQLIGRSEANRATFPFLNRNLDEAVSNVFMFHYWQSRAGGLYVKEMAKHPFLAAAYGRISQQLNEEAEANGYPPWMKGFFHLASSPAGYALFASPFDLASTFLTFADFQMGGVEGELNELTFLGRMRANAPLMISPLLDFVGYSLGLYGEDASVPDPSALRRPAKMAAELLNLANAYGHLKPLNDLGFGVDAAGNPVPIPVKPLDQLWGTVGNRISTLLHEVTGLPPVKVPPADGTDERNVRTFLDQVVRERYPEATEDEVWDISDEAWRDKDNDLYQEAYRMSAELPGAALDTPLPDWVDGVIGRAVRNWAPVQTYAMPEGRALDSNMKLNRPSTLPDRIVGDGYDANDAKYGMSKTQEARDLARGVEVYYDLYPDDLRAFKATNNALRYGDATEPVTVGGVTYAPEEINALDDDARRALSDAYMEEQGYTWADIDKADAAQAAYLASHPQVRGYLDYQNSIEADPTGGWQAIADLAAANPNYARHLRGIDKPWGSGDFLAAAKSGEAYLASLGQRGSVYSPTDSLDTGTADPRGRFAPGSPDFRQQREQAAAEIDAYLAQAEVMDEVLGPGHGLKPGDYIGDGYGAVKDAMDARGLEMVGKGGVAADYAAYVEAGGDPSLDVFLDSQRYFPDSREFADAPASAQPAPSQSQQTSVPAQQGVPQSTPQRWQVGAVGEVDLRDGPSAGNGRITTIQSGIGLTELERQGQWMKVRAPGGYVGWVPLEYLTAF